MTAKFNRDKFASFMEPRHLALAVIVLFGLTVVGPPRLWGQCTMITNIQTTVSPTTVQSGNPTTVTVTFTLNTPVTGCNSGYSLKYDVVYGAFDPGGHLTYVGDVWIYAGDSSGQISFVSGTYSFTTPTVLTWIVGPYPHAYLEVIPSGQHEQPANLGPCKQCQQQGGQPINLSTGNVWIPRRDFSLPGLGGGLEVSRVWNSRWPFASPPTLDGMFGSGWQSTYEEKLTGPDSNNNLIYWRGDGNGWTFTYNPTLSTYTLTSPTDERAQLVSTGGGGFTLTLSDGTQRIFNSADLLTTIIDRNNNQTAIAYDSSNRISSVTSPNGKAITFTYGDSANPFQATSVQDGVGTIATYTYGSNSQLTMVTYADSSTINYSYDSTNSLILSVTDGMSKVLEAHTYDSQFRGLTSTRAYGVDSVSVSY